MNQATDRKSLPVDPSGVTADVVGAFFDGRLTCSTIELASPNTPMLDCVYASSGFSICTAVSEVTAALLPELPVPPLPPVCPPEPDEPLPLLLDPLLDEVLLELDVAGCGLRNTTDRMSIDIRCRTARAICVRSNWSRPAVANRVCKLMAA